MILTTSAALPAITNVQLQIHHSIARTVFGLLTNSVLTDVTCRQANANPQTAHPGNINATDQIPIRLPTIAITDFGECMKHVMKVASLPQENAKNPVIKSVIKYGHPHLSRQSIRKKLWNIATI